MKSSFQDQWPHCADHSECPYQLLLLQKKCSTNRILCFECLYSEEKTKCKEEITETIPLSIALRSPGTIIDQLKNDSQSKSLKGLFKICELDLEKQFNEQILKFELLSKIFIQMKEQITQKLKEYKQIQEELKKQKESFFEKCNCNLLRQLIDQLKEVDKQFKSDQYMQIILKINSTIEEMIKDNCGLITKNTNEILQSHRQTKMNLIKPNNDLLISQITQLFQEYTQFIEDLNKNINQRQLQFQIPQFKVLTNEYFYTIIDKIEQGSKKQIKQLNLIYLGTRDGLNANGYWSKVNGKKNLLIIMKSQINQVFGGYSPCQWESSSSGRYVQDDTLTSFLFSQTKNQIYQLNQNNKQYAINCLSSYGPFFGGGNWHDMYINTDFNSGQSNLGNTYILDQQYMSQRDTHLFGEKSTKIIECEIYEIILS